MQMPDVCLKPLVISAMPVSLVLWLCFEMKLQLL